MSGIESLVVELWDDDPAMREAAAAKLHELGMELADPTVDVWRANREFAALLKEEMNVGVAVWPQHFEKIRLAWGSPRLAEVPPDQDAMEFELHIHEGAGLDVLTTRASGQGGVIDKFLERFGEGIQQVELVVKEVDKATQILRTQFGQSPVYPETRPGADGTRVNFFLASAAGGKKVLIELVEEKS